MGISSSIQVPAPTNWQDFERLMRRLFSEILKDPNTYRHGRQGQKQHGVDVCGQRNCENKNWVGKAPYVKFIKAYELEDQITSSGFEVLEADNYPVTALSRYIVARKIMI